MGVRYRIRILLYITSGLLAAGVLIAQNSLGIGTYNPDPSAALDIQSTSKGVLIPRLTQVQRDAIGSPALWLLIFNTTSQQFEYWNGTAWIPLISTQNVSNSSWSLSGNTLVGTEFLGSVNPYPLIIRTDNIERMRIDPTGFVGIGTTTPTHQLHVKAALDPLRLEGLQELSGASTVLVSDAAGVVYTTSASALAAANAWSLTGNSGTDPATNFLGTIDAQPLAIRTNNQERMRITTTGNVGIGATSPSRTLVVRGTLDVGDGNSSLPSGQQNVIFGNQTSDLSQNVYNVLSDLEVTANATTNQLYVAGYYNLNLQGPGDYSSTLLYALGGQLDYYGSGTVAAASGLSGAVVLRAGGNITDAKAVRARVANLGSGTVTNAINFAVESPAGSGTFTNLIGLYIPQLSAGSNNISILLGNTIPAGNFALYSGVNVPTYFAGRVGIGTTAPTHPLHVKAGSNPLRLEGLQVTSGSSTVLVSDALGIVYTTNASSFVVANAWSLGGNTLVGTEFLGSVNARPLVIRTSNQERMRITTAGDVGIGTTSPTAQLMIVESAAGAAVVRVQNIDAAGLSGIEFLTATAAVMGYVGLEPGGTALRVYSGADAIRFYTNGVERVRITTTGNVGIGALDPQYPLHLEGDGMMYAAGQFGKGLTIPAGAKTAFIWNPRKAALRAGQVTATQWDDDNVGAFSVAFGKNNRAQGDFAVAIGGEGNEVDAAYAIAGGRNMKVEKAATHTFVWGAADQPVAVEIANAFLIGPGGFPYRVGINTSTPQFALDLPNVNQPTVGQARANAWYTYADPLRWSAVETIDSAYFLLSKLQPLRYHHSDGTTGYAIDPQGLAHLIPEITMQQDSTTWSINYDALIPILVAAIQQQAQEIRQLRRQNNDMQQQVAEIQQLRRQLAVMQRQMAQMQRLYSQVQYLLSQHRQRNEAVKGLVR